MPLLNYLQYFAERKDKARERELQDSASQWLSGYDGAKTPEERQQALAGINTAVPAPQAAQPQSGWDWLSSQGQRMAGNVSGSVIQGLQQRYPYFGQNGALNFTQNGPWRR